MDDRLEEIRGRLEAGYLLPISPSHVRGDTKAALADIRFLLDEVERLRREGNAIGQASDS